MKKRLYVFFLISMLSLPFGCHANNAEDLPLTFMKDIISGKINEAVNQYFSTNPFVSQKPQQIAFVKTQIESGFKIYGAPFAYELAIKEEISPSLQRFVFITKHKYLALAWEFYIYRPDKDWIASNMSFSDKMDLLQTKK